MDIQSPAPEIKRRRGKKNKEQDGENEAALAQTNKPKKAKKEKKPKSAKKKRFGTGLIIMLSVLVFALLVTAVYVIIHFNIDGWRDKLIDTVNSLDPIYVENKIRINNLDERNREATLLEKQLQAAESDLQTRIEAVEQREAEAQTGVVTRTPIYRPPISDELLTDLQNLAKTYAAMEPATAAVILATLYDLEDMAAIIYYMRPAAAAEILTEMDVRLAAQITEELLSQ